MSGGSLFCWFHNFLSIKLYGSGMSWERYVPCVYWQCLGQWGFDKLDWQASKPVSDSRDGVKVGLSFYQQGEVEVGIGKNGGWEHHGKSN